MENLTQSFNTMRLNCTDVAFKTPPHTESNLPEIQQIIVNILQENKYLKNEIQRLHMLLANKRVIIPNWVH